MVQHNVARQRYHHDSLFRDDSEDDDEPQPKIKRTRMLHLRCICLLYVYLLLLLNVHNWSNTSRHVALTLILPSAPFRWDDHHSSWSCYVNDGPWMYPSTKYGKLFRRRFRLPWQAFKEIVCMHREEHDFNEGPDAVGRPCVPIELKILGVLRVLGRGYTFDDVAEHVVSGEEIHRVFFIKFVDVYASKYVDRWVAAPKTSAELLKKTTEYREAKLNGCAGDTANIQRIPPHDSS